jgi:hypothetical protein
VEGKSSSWDSEVMGVATELHNIGVTHTNQVYLSDLGGHAVPRRQITESGRKHRTLDIMQP